MENSLPSRFLFLLSFSLIGRISWMIYNMYLHLSPLAPVYVLSLYHSIVSPIPDVIYDCPSLETLLASDNQISFLNVDGFLKMRSLMTLDVSNNDISQVPPQLGLVQWLK